jgi:hypothetical protein
VLLVPVLVPEVSVSPLAEVPVAEPFERGLPVLVAPVEPVPGLLPLPHWVLPLAAPLPVAVLPFDIVDVLPAASRVPVELQAARLMAIRAPINTPWQVFMMHSYV